MKTLPLSFKAVIFVCHASFIRKNQKDRIKLVLAQILKIVANSNMPTKSN